VVGTLTPMESSSSVGTDTLSVKKWQFSGIKDGSSSTLHEYINPFDNVPTKLSRTAEETCDSGIPSMLWEVMADQGKETSLSSHSSSLQKDLTESNAVPLGIGTKPVDQDSGFSMHDTSGLSLDVAEPMHWVPSDSREDSRFQDCSSGFHSEFDSSVADGNIGSSDVMDPDLERCTDSHSNAIVNFHSKDLDTNSGFPINIHSTTAATDSGT